jgi:hypothetical protein
MKVSKQFLDAVLPKRMRGSQLDNEYTPSKQPIRVAKTIKPDSEVNFNEVFTNAHREVNKLKFNK